MTTKDEFIARADSLKGAYIDYGRCLYQMALQNDLLDDVYNYMIDKAKDVNELDWYVYDLMGKPKPQLVIIDDETGEDCTEECIKKYREISAAHSRDNIQEYTKQDMKDYYSMAN